jgi:hypothetical protein
MRLNNMEEYGVVMSRMDNPDGRSNNGLCTNRDGLGARVHYGRGSLI